MKTLLFLILLAASSHTVPAAQQRTANGGILRLSRDAALRDGQLEAGTVLMSSARGLVRAKPELLKVGRAELTCRGTALIAKTPQGGMKVTCLEGQLIVGLDKERLRLEAGRMVLIDRSTVEVPDTVEINLERLLDTSALTRNDRGAPLPGAPAIEREIARQRKALARGRLVASGVAMKDSGHTATVAGSSPSTTDQRGASPSGVSTSSTSTASASTGAPSVATASVQSATACA
ncbi:MAG: hypothetical protein ACKV19_01335 [Verrucomicrobiales bacterium]